MGILGRSNPQKNQRNGTTIIAAGTELVGDLTLSDSLHLDGRITGTIKSESDITIGEQGQFDGDVEARTVLVSGRLDGNVDAERLEIVSGGRVDGEVRVAELVIESGGRFNGSSEIRSKQEATRQLGYEREPIEAVPYSAGNKPESKPSESRSESETRTPQRTAEFTS